MSLGLFADVLSTYRECKCGIRHSRGVHTSLQATSVVLILRMCCTWNMKADAWIHQLEMNDGDTLEVHQEQIGGGMSG